MVSISTAIRNDASTTKTINKIDHHSTDPDAGKDGASCTSVFRHQTQTTTVLNRSRTRHRHQNEQEEENNDNSFRRSSHTQLQLIMNSRKKKRKIRNAGAGMRIVRPTEQLLLDEPLPMDTKIISPLERFFTALLRSPLAEYLGKHSEPRDEQQRQQEVEDWRKICRRVSLNVVSASSSVAAGHQPETLTAEDDLYHRQKLASLILEEARHVLTEAIRLMWSQQQLQNNSQGISYASDHCGRNNSERTAKMSVATSNNRWELVDCASAPIPQPTSYGTLKLSFSVVRTSSPPLPISSDRLAHGADTISKGASVLRPGSVIALVPVTEHRSRNTSNIESTGNSVDKFTLGVILTNSTNFRNSSHSRMKQSFELTDSSARTNGVGILTSDVVEVMVMQAHWPGSGDKLGQKWTAILLSSLITEGRCFVALTHPPNSPGFWSTWPTANRCGDSPIDFLEYTPLKSVDSHNSSAAIWHCLSQLNSKQLEAANTFLHAGPDTVTLVKGPPGTGKTSLLVAVIAYLTFQRQKPKTIQSKPKENPNVDHGRDSPSTDQPTRRRLLVCAPTNKAITVLASRFVEAMTMSDESHDGINNLNSLHRYNTNILLVGDADKLFVEDRTNKATMAEKPKKTDGPIVDHSNLLLRSIFVYSWVDHQKNGYAQISNMLASNSKDKQCVGRLLQSAEKLEQCLSQRLHAAEFSRLIDLAQQTRELIKTLRTGAYGATLTTQIQSSIRQLLEELASFSSDAVCKELVRTAHVTFCTLSTSGGGIFRGSGPLHDLIVDEAAAATEPELRIPLHLQPSRLLAVGDPMQLPAMVLSPTASRLGLAKSLHERLMCESCRDYILLDCQYRMDPAIAAFPMAHFYHSKVKNASRVNTNPLIQNADWLRKFGNPYIFYHVSGAEERTSSGSYCNHAEAMVVVDVISHLAKNTRSVSSPPASLFPGGNAADGSIRVITFYQGQAQLIQTLLRRNRSLSTQAVLVATVDSSQGCEADIVIVSFVRAGGSAVQIHRTHPTETTVTTRNNTVGFLADDRRLNVALTRARYQLICVGNGKFMQEKMHSAATLRRLVEDATIKNLMIDRVC